MSPHRHRTATALASVIALAGAVGLASCGGDDDDSADSALETSPDTTADSGDETGATAPTTAAAVESEPVEVTFPSGATANHPSSWTSYGEGFTGSIELAIPGVANVSLRDGAASEYMYGPMLPDQETLDGAFDMLEFGLGALPVGERTTVDIDGQEVLMATVDNNGVPAIAAVTAVGDSYASVYAESLDGPLPDDAVDAILAALVSITPPA